MEISFTTIYPDRLGICVVLPSLQSNTALKLFLQQYYYFISFLQVLMPNGRYKGQKLINDVRTNTAPNTNSTIPTVPETV